MAMSPRNIMHNLGLALDGKLATYKQLRMAFYNAGYGPKKTDKWIDLYLATGIITEEKDENGIPMFDSEWFIKPSKAEILSA